MNAAFTLLVVSLAGMAGVLALSFFEERRRRIVARALRAECDARLGALARRTRFALEQLAMGRGGFGRVRAFARIVRRRSISVAEEVRALMNHVPERLIAAALGRRPEGGDASARASAFLKRVAEYKQHPSDRA